MKLYLYLKTYCFIQTIIGLLQIINAMTVDFSPLMHKMIQSNNIEQAINILHNDPQCIYHLDAMYNTPLHIAALYGNTFLCKKLIKANACINAVNIKGEPPLWNAIYSNNPKTILLFLQHQAIITHINYTKNTILHHAAFSRNPDIIFTLLSYNQVDVNAKNTQGNTILHLAAYMNNSKLVKMLITTYNAKTSIENNNNKKSIDLATGEVLRILKKTRTNAAKNPLTHDDKTKVPLHDHPLPITHVQNQPIKHNASCQIPTIHKLIIDQKKLDAYNFIFDNKQCIHDVDSNNDTPLHLAALYGQYELCAYLLQINANIHALNNLGEPPLWCAIRGHNKEIVILLLTHHAFLGHYNKENMNIFHVALFFSNQEILALLLDQKPYAVDMQDHNGNTLLHLAMIKNDRNLVEMLLKKYNAKTHILNHQGKTPITLACELKRHNIIKLFTPQ